MFLSFLFACADASRPGDTTGEPDPTDTDTPPGDVLRSEVSREMAPSTANVAALATSENTFGWDLTRHLLLAAPDEDLAVSPWSLGVAFAQAYAGAGEPAKTALATMFH